MSHDSEDPNADVQYHLEVGPDDVAETVLLPGNPERLEKIVAFWDDYEMRAHHREYRTATGEADGTPISVTSTGIGSPPLRSPSRNWLESASRRSSGSAPAVRSSPRWPSATW